MKKKLSVISICSFVTDIKGQSANLRGGAGECCPEETFGPYDDTINPDVGCLDPE